MKIHTIEVSSKLTRNDYFEIQKELKKEYPNKWKALRTGMQFFGLSEKGILVNMSIIKKNDYYSYNILYIISGRRVMEPNNYVDLFDTNEYTVLEKEVNKILSNTCKLLPKLKDCKLARVDFCQNAMLGRGEAARRYIKIAKRGNVPPKLKIFKFYDSVAKRKQPSKRDHTVCAGNYVEISIYDKQAEMKSQRKGVFPEGEIERAEGMVRIEIRCKEGKVRELKKKYKISTISQFMAHAKQIGEEVFTYYLGKMYGSGDIYTLKEALERINMSGYTKKTVQQLKEFVTDFMRLKVLLPHLSITSRPTEAIKLKTF